MCITAQSVAATGAAPVSGVGSYPANGVGITGSPFDMGTRADFYVGRDKQAEWLGSIAWDGYPQGIDRDVLLAETEPQFRSLVDAFFDGRDDVTQPDRGWPWPWDDSQTTDFAYAFDGGRVWASCFGCEWFDPKVEDVDYDALADKAAVFPNMKARQNIRWDKGSGLIVVSVPRE